jgi:protein-tyrosine phosphatase
MSGVEKNLDKWRRVSAGGANVQGTVLVPTKMFARNEILEHTAEKWLEENRNIRLVDDLSSEQNPYETSCKKVKLAFVAKSVPTLEQVEQFVKVVQEFRAEFPEYWIAVHCHYGFNRTGFMIASYCCQVLFISPFEALERFAAVRAPGIKHAHFKRELVQRYANFVSLSPRIEAILNVHEEDNIL